MSEAEMQKITSLAASADAVAAGKFYDPSQELVLGLRKAAVQGLDALLHGRKAPENEDEGVKAIQDEVDVFAASGNDVVQAGQCTVQDWLRYIRFDKTSEEKFSNGMRDKGRVGKDLRYFSEHERATEAKLNKAHVVALRLYTTHAFQYINTPLRKGEVCPLPVTTYLAYEAIKRLRAEYSDMPLREVKTLWRGMQNRHLGADFWRHGGTELAFLSTTSDLGVAVQYSLSKASLFFKIVADNWLSVGVNVQWLSAFPEERELIYPPLTFLQPTGRSETLEVVRHGEPLSITVVEVRPVIA